VLRIPKERLWFPLLAVMAHNKPEEPAEAAAGAVVSAAWPLHDFVITNIVWCIAHK